MYVCTKCGNYKSFTVSIPETVTNKLVRVCGREYELARFEEESIFVKNDCAMQEIEETMVCNECESMGIVEVPSEYLDIELQIELYHSLKAGVLSEKTQKKMKKEASEVGDEIDPKDLETENP